MTIDFEGKLVSSTPRGIWHCPFNCGDPRFAEPKWKTEKGFRGHMLTCSKRPSAVKAREEQLIIQRGQEARDEHEALEACRIQVGDKIHYVHEIVVKPQYETRGTRQVRVRYEDEKRYEARTDVVESRLFVHDHIWLNGTIPLYRLCGSREEAELKAAELTRGDEEARKQAALYR